MLLDHNGDFTPEAVSPDGERAGFSETTDRIPYLRACVRAHGRPAVGAA